MIVTIVENKDKDKFTNEIAKLLQRYPNAQVQYSVGHGLALGGSSRVMYTALVIVR